MWCWPIHGGSGGESQAARAEFSAHRFGDMRTQEQLHEHYPIERELADRLRLAPRSQRRGLYCRAPRQRDVDGLLALLRGFPMRALLGLRVAAMRPRAG